MEVYWSKEERTESREKGMEEGGKKMERGKGLYPFVAQKLIIQIIKNISSMKKYKECNRGTT